MIQLTRRLRTYFTRKRVKNKNKKKTVQRVWTRILLALLHVTEVAHVVDDLLDAADPLAGHFAVGGHQVQVLLAALEDDGEALVFIHRVGVFIQPLRLAAQAQGVDVVDGDWSRSKPTFRFHSHLSC